MSRFRGRQPAGDWTLTVCNISPDTSGTLSCPYLDLTEGVVPASSLISGPTAGEPDTDYDFSTGVQPISTTLPLTYTWQATGQSTVIREKSQLTDMVTFSWDSTGVKTITVGYGHGYIPDFDLFLADADQYPNADTNSSSAKRVGQLYLHADDPEVIPLTVLPSEPGGQQQI